MKSIKFKQALLVTGFSLLSNLAYADLSTECAVINNSDDRVVASANFSTPVTGDLYLAVKVNEQFLFFTDGGQGTSLTPTPFSENTEYSGTLPLFDFSSAGIESGRYQLFNVVTFSGTDPLNFTNWIGGLSGLSSINFNIGLSTEEHRDFDGDCFSDDDRDQDGFHDDDRDRDGFSDDDRDRDGFSDDDRDRDGFHDDDRDRDGFHDDDRDQDGFHDNGDDSNDNDNDNDSDQR